jgi:heat shock protein HtpX
MKPTGLNTYIWNNNLKSIILLCLFPFLFFLLDFLFFTLTVGSMATEPLMPGYVHQAGEMSVNSKLTINDKVISHISSTWERAQIMSLIGFSFLTLTWHWIALAVSVWFGIAYLSHGAMIRAATRSTPITRAEAPELYNLLENLCISRGIRTPKLYIIEASELNAFASGIDQRTFSITVTRGLLHTLDQRELQAVLGHELTHIINRDVRLLIISIIFVGIFTFIAQLMIRSLTSGNIRINVGNNQQRRGGLFLVLIAVGLSIFGYLLAVIIRFAISRRREFLADAGSVMLTKDPDAMISALIKISKNSEVPGTVSEVKAMFIENPPLPGILDIFSTHPALEARIQALRDYMS